MQPSSPGGRLSSNPKIEAVLWGNDSVLMHTEPLFLQANREMLGGTGIELTEPLYKEISFRQGRSVFEFATGRSTTWSQPPNSPARSIRSLQVWVESCQ